MNFQIANLKSTDPNYNSIMKMFRYYNLLLPMFTYYENFRGILFTDEEADTARLAMEKIEAFLLPKIAELTGINLRS